MDRSRFAMVAVSCLMLLALQAGGVHLHTSTEGGGLNLHGAHWHGADPDSHDHAADVDLTIIELGTLWEQLGALHGHSELQLAAARLVRWQGHTRAPPGTPAATAARLRPPLRAPPMAS